MAPSSLPLDDLLDEHENGRFQWIHILVVCFIGFIAGENQYSFVLLVAVPDHRCTIPGHNDTNFALNRTVLERWIPCSLDANGDRVFDKCMVFKEELTSDNSNCGIQNNTEKCDSWVYDFSAYGKTAVSEWNLVCDRRALQALLQDCFLFGMLFGGVLCGAVSDWKGRKKATVGFLVSHIVFGLLNVFAWEKIGFSVSFVVVAKSILRRIEIFYNVFRLDK